MGDAAPTTEFWAAMFDTAADRYDQSGVPFFGPIAQGLVRRLAPATAEQVLDLGSGRGAATLPLAAAVGARGSVTAVDASGRMVELLSETLAERGIDNVTVQQGDAAAPPPGPYDVVCASLLLFFLPDPGAGLAAWREQLVPGGRVGVSSFAPWPPSMKGVTDVLEAYLPPDAPMTNQMPPAFGTDEGVEELFRGAGFTDVRTEREVFPVPYDDVRQFRAWSMGTALRGLWMHVPEDEVPVAMERIDSALVELDYTLEVDIRYTLARA